jgi:hypothetical protein
VVRVLCGFRLVGGPGAGELGWGEIAVGRVGPVAVVVDAPIVEVDAGLEQRVELPGSTLHAR